MIQKQDIKIRYSRRFKKEYKRANSKIKSAFGKCVSIFLQNPFNQLLNNHALTGQLEGYRSINVTGDWRAHYSEKLMGDKVEVTFEAIGTHSQLYG